MSGPVFPISRPALLLCSILAMACGSGATSTSPDFGVDGVSPELLVPGSTLTVKGFGFPLTDMGTLTIQIEGEVGSETLKVGGTAEVLDSGTATLSLSAPFIDALIASQEPFSGTLKATRRLADSKKKDESTLPVELRAAASLTPQILQLAPTAFHLGDLVVLEGDGFLLPPEGRSALLLSGQFDIPSPQGVQQVTDLEIPLTVSDRTHATFAMTPDKLSLYPGTFTGVVRAVNYPQNGPQTQSEPTSATLELLPASIEALAPGQIRRGQIFSVTGAGFLPGNPVDELATVLELQGTLTTPDGASIPLTGQNAVVLFPDSFQSNTQMDFVLRITLDSQGDPQGFGLIPGTFVGTATPIVYFGSQSYRGQGLPVTLRVRQPVQLVFVKFLPSFDDAFEDFGLYAVAGTIKERIVQRAQSYYQGINIQFVDQRPTQYAEYSVIELAGEDPNGKGLLGLDNTTGKDTGNLRFDDVIGGKNAETEEQGFYAYGGVFLRSFLGFSPTLGQGAEALASDRFDEVFAPFCPELMGIPVEPEDLDNQIRQAELDEAIRVLGNLVGSTVAHEVGHSLGLAAVPGQPEEYHNLGDNPGWLMDAGAARPFLERAELDGHGPEFFEENSFNYLLSILPMDEDGNE